MTEQQTIINEKMSRLNNLQQLYQSYIITQDGVPTDVKNEIDTLRNELRTLLIAEGETV